jgi:hypothetical protein
MPKPMDDVQVSSRSHRADAKIFEWGKVLFRTAFWHLEDYLHVMDDDIQGLGYERHWRRSKAATLRDQVPNAPVGIWEPASSTTRSGIRSSTGWKSHATRPSAL